MVKAKEIHSGDLVLYSPEPDYYGLGEVQYQALYQSCPTQFWMVKWPNQPGLSMCEEQFIRKLR